MRSSVCLFQRGSESFLGLPGVLLVAASLLITGSQEVEENIQEYLKTKTNKQKILVQGGIKAHIYLGVKAQNCVHSFFIRHSFCGLSEEPSHVLRLAVHR